MTRKADHLRVAAGRAAGVMYREILRQIERDGYGARPGRAVVPRRRKLALALGVTTRRSAPAARASALQR